MIGKAVRSRHVRVDYTDFADPLKLSYIADDITLVQIESLTVETIVMWEHQWDWLVKVVAARPIAIDTGPLTGYYSSQRSDPKSIYGVPVRLA